MRFELTAAEDILILTLDEWGKQPQQRAFRSTRRGMKTKMGIPKVRAREPAETKKLLAGTFAAGQESGLGRVEYEPEGLYGWRARIRDFCLKWKRSRAGLSFKPADGVLNALLRRFGCSGFVPQYYKFLAGFVLTFKTTRILELGTHYGGAAEAFCHALVRLGAADEARLVTVDRRLLAPHRLRTYGFVHRIKGDSLGARTIGRAKALFQGVPIDLLFVDTIHRSEQALAEFCRYSSDLDPRFVLFDDIRINPSMETLWRRLKAEYGEAALDITDASRREKNVGFGLVVRR